MMSLAVNQIPQNCEHTAPCAIDRAAHVAAWASFRVAEAEGIYNEAPTVSLIQGDASPQAYPEMRIFVSCSEGRDAEFFAVNFKGKFQTE